MRALGSLTEQQSLMVNCTTITMEPGINSASHNNNIRIAVDPRTLEHTNNMHNANTNGSGGSQNLNQHHPNNSNSMGHGHTNNSNNSNHNNIGNSDNNNINMSALRLQAQQLATTLELHPDIVLSSLMMDEPDERPHVCEECGANYKTRTHLRRHMFVHLKNRPYSCAECNRGFNRKGIQ